MALKIGYAGDRELSVKVLSYLKCQGIIPHLLLISDSPNCSHSNELKELCSELDTSNSGEGL